MKHYRDVSNRLKRTLVTVTGLSVVALLLIGCQGKPPYNPDADPHLFEFLQDGTTTREEVKLRLGDPSMSLEQEGILTYRVVEQSDHSFYVVRWNLLRPWLDVSYSLVLVFDVNQVLSQHSMVPVQ